MIRELILFRPFFSLLLLLSFSPFCTYKPTSQIHPRACLKTLNYCFFLPKKGCLLCLKGLKYRRNFAVFFLIFTLLGWMIRQYGGFKTDSRVYLRSQTCWDIRQKAPDARRMSAALLCGTQSNATQQMELFGRIEQRWGVFRYILAFFTLAAVLSVLLSTFSTVSLKL